MMGSNRSEPTEVPAKTTAKSKQKSLHAENIIVSVDKGIVSYGSSSSSFPGHPVRPFEYLKDDLVAMAEYKLSFEQYGMLYRGEEVSTPSFTATSSKPATLEHIDYEMKDRTFYVFPYTHGRRVVGDVPEVEYFEKIGTASSFRLYAEPRKYFVNGNEFSTKYFVKYGRSFYPLATFTMGFYPQACIFVPPIR